jgi:hypothetical protein
MGNGLCGGTWSGCCSADGIVVDSARGAEGPAACDKRGLDGGISANVGWLAHSAGAPVGAVMPALAGPPL